MYDNYAKIRDARGYSDAKVAKLAGISRAVFTRWKQGTTAPSNENRYKICQALGIPPTMHFTGVNDQQEFVIENTNVDMSQNDALKGFKRRIANYAIRCQNGAIVNLTDEQYKELEKSIDAFIDAWVFTHIKE